jgi:pyruvate kinase
MMDRIIAQTESDPYYREAIAASQETPVNASSADAIGYAMRHVTTLLDAVATVAYTTSGYSALRMARERPGKPILGMTPQPAVARRLALVWGVHPVLCHAVIDAMEVSDLACRTVREEGFGSAGQSIVISAGMPFGTPGTTNLLRIAQLS